MLIDSRFVVSAVVLSIALFLGTKCFEQETEAAAADTVLIHAKIYTVNARQTWAEALAVRAGKIVAVGSDSEIRKYQGPNSRMIDAEGHLVLPGFTDSHIHFLDGSLSLTQVSLDDATSVGEIQQRVKAYAIANPKLPWILGRGWQYTVFGATGLPNKSILDQCVPDRPVYLESFDGHSWWANTAALKMAGIARDSADPPGGQFVRDPGTGEPTGAVKEDAADAVIRRVIPKPSRAQTLDALRHGMHEANAVGLVGAISPDGVRVGDADFAALDIYAGLKRAGDLTLRFYIGSRIEP